MQMPQNCKCKIVCNPGLAGKIQNNLNSGLILLNAHLIHYIFNHNIEKINSCTLILRN